MGWGYRRGAWWAAGWLGRALVRPYILAWAGDKKRAGQLAVVRLLGGSDLLSHFRSTIGAVRFNFSVRNGKRWNPHAITTLVSFSPLCVRCVKVRSFLEVQNAVSRAVVPLEASSVSFYSRPRLRSAFSCVKAWLRGFVLPLRCCLVASALLALSAVLLSQGKLSGY